MPHAYQVEGVSVTLFVIKHLLKSLSDETTGNNAGFSHRPFFKKCVQICGLET